MQYSDILEYDSGVDDEVNSDHINILDNKKNTIRVVRGRVRECVL